MNGRKSNCFLKLVIIVKIEEKEKQNNTGKRMCFELNLCFELNRFPHISVVSYFNHVLFFE